MASFKAQKAFGPAFMRIDGDAQFGLDKIILGAAPGLGTPAAADTIDFLMPAGARLAQLEFFMDDMDTGATFVFGVGYRPVNPLSAMAAAPTYFMPAGQTIGQTGGRLECAFKPIKFEEDVFVTLTVGTASTGIAAGAEIHMIAGYNCEGAK